MNRRESIVSKEGEEVKSVLGQDDRTDRGIGHRVSGPEA